jgi:hypothetical protein
MDPIEASDCHSSMHDRLSHTDRDLLKLSDQTTGRISPIERVLRGTSYKYGTAIRMLLERGGSFQTRYERTLIVDAAQKEVLEQAGLIEGIGFKPVSGKGDGQKKDAG